MSSVPKKIERTTYIKINLKQNKNLISLYSKIKDRNKLYTKSRIGQLFILSQAQHLIAMTHQNQAEEQSTPNFHQQQIAVSPFNAAVPPNLSFSQQAVSNRLSPSKITNQSTMTPSATGSFECDTFRSIRDLIHQMSAEKIVLRDRNVDDNVDRQFQQTRTVLSLKNQIAYLRDTLSSQQDKLTNSEQNFEKHMAQSQNRHRKEINKYIDLFSNRESEIENLKKSIKSLTTRNMHLTSELQQFSQRKQTLESTIQKSLESLRANVKQFNYSLEENQLDKAVLQGKYKQLCDKMEQVIKQFQESESSRAKLEKKYEKVKENYETCRNQCVQLRFQVERYKIKIKDVPSQRQYQDRTGFDGWVKETMEKVTILASQIAQKINLTQAMESATQSLNQAALKIKEMTRENEDLKIELYHRQVQNDELHLKLEGGKYEDQILQERNPSLFQLLLAKKAEIENFEAKINDLEKLAMTAENELNLGIQDSCPKCRFKAQITTEERGINYSQQVDTRKISKTKFDEIIREMETQRERALLKEREAFEKSRELDRVKIQDQQELIASLRKENDKLRILFESSEREKRGLREQLQQVQQKKRNLKKTKNKIKCPVCCNEISTYGKNVKCSECLLKMHPQCQKDHECKQIQEGDSFYDN